MKTIQFFVVCLMLLMINSCAILDKYEIQTTNIDLTSFEKQGIFVTTGDLSIEYKPISIISAQCFHGFISKNSKNQKSFSGNDDIYYSNINNNSEYYSKQSLTYKFCDIEDLFADVIERVKTLGANGIIKLEIKGISRGAGTDKTRIQTGVEVSGLAINIK